MNEYYDILNYPHYELKYHPRMNIENRAAQFAPFDALTGYKEEIQEVKRIVTPKKILTEEEISILNSKMQTLKENQRIKVEYFIPDKNKVGGIYRIYEGFFSKINIISQEIIFQDKKRIKLKEIIKIDNI